MTPLQSKAEGKFQQTNMVKSSVKPWQY